jgi:transposase
MAAGDATKQDSGALRALMTIDPDSLRSDPDALVEAFREVQKFARKLLEDNALLKTRLESELRARYGPSSERGALLSPDQGLLFPEPGSQGSPLPSASPSPAPTPTLAPERSESALPKEPKGRNGRRPLPANLPRRRVLHELDEQDRLCPHCGKPMAKIGEEVSSQLEYEPACFHVIEHVRPKYACPEHEEAGVLTALPAPAPIAKGLAGPGLLAQVAVSKYADHLPLNRQEQIFARHGVDLVRSTLGDWIGEMAKLLEPVREHMAREILKGLKINTDDIPVEVREKGRKTTREARLWVYIGDETHPFTVFDYTPTHEKSGPERMLEGYRSYLQADAYAGYEGIYEKGATEVGCMAHARRGFWKALPSDLAHAQAMLEMIGRLYKIERELHDCSPEERLAARRERSKPILDEMKAWLDREALAVLPKSPIGKAIAYATNQWTALCRFLEDGRLEIDNNRAERALRGIAVGRKNWLFLGNHEGGSRAAIIYSVIATCKDHGVDPFAYLRDVLARLPTYRGDYAALTPLAWKRAREGAAARPPDS